MSDIKYNFQNLAPVDDVILEVYEDSLNFIFNEQSIRNIAISGAYGSGKSSLLATYKKKYPHLKFIHISLAHFESPESDNNPSKKGDKPLLNESAIEGRILNQLIHRIPVEKIKQTNFRVKRKISRKEVFLSTALLMAAFLCGLHLFLFDTWSNFVADFSDDFIYESLYFSTTSSSRLISGIICFCVLFYFVYSFIQIQKNKNIFKKFIFQGAELEILGENNDSYFDKYLNEVLYLFKNSESNVIVFEDMDRFNSNLIFERLREVNTLVNIQLQKEKKDPLRFFYLLRDDIFISKDRTKFFDYIVPVIPVVDGSNSYDEFIEFFKKGGYFDKLDNKFLKELSLYVDDMRLLKNIYNEFVIYFNRLNTTDLDYDKMLAIITYKNLFPRDFSDLQLGRGFIFTLFNKKDMFISTKVEKIHALINEKKKELESINDEILVTQEELDLLFNRKGSFSYRGYSGLTREDQLDYDRRNQIIINKKNRTTLSLEQEILHLEQELALIQTKPLQDIITRDNIDSIFSVTSINDIGKINKFEEVRGNDYFALLKYLVSHGKINETYPDYMTYFRGNSISFADKTFLRSVLEKKAKGYTYKLKNPRLVLDYLYLEHFDQEEVLNFDLIQYLLRDTSYEVYLDILLNQLKKTSNFKFIEDFLNTDIDEIGEFVKKLNIQWPQMISCAWNNQLLNKNQICIYIINSLYYSDESTLKRMNEEDFLTTYISHNADYLCIDEPKVDILISKFKLLDVSFFSINYDSANKKLFEEVYRESLYQINFENISLMLKKMHGVTSDDNIVHKNYTTVLLQTGYPLAEYIEDNIEKYLALIIDSSEGVICDDENAALLLLNNENILPGWKTKYIDVLSTKIISINSVVDQSLWGILFDRDLPLYNIENILSYYSEIKVVDDTIVLFINRGESTLDFTNVESICDEGIVSKFFDSVIVCKNIDNDKYKQILSSIGYNYNQFYFEDISTEKMNIIIDTNTVEMNTENLGFIREKYKDNLFHFIQKNIIRYVDTMSEDFFDINEAIEILTWDIEESIKIKILNFSNDAISVIGKEYSTPITKHILNHNFEHQDLEELLSSYEEWDESIQQTIIDLAISNISEVYETEDISMLLLEDLLYSDELETEKKIRLFILMVPRLTIDSFKKHLDILGLNNYLKIFEPNSRPKFPINETNTELLAALKNRKWLLDFKEHTDKHGYYKIIRQRLSKSIATELL
ncbi:hypothetical protein [Clostridium polynesiense]|uniref:YobI family P-loop NTPase n=1 Tax=Clostridium polynesiense TaxID=1325933 RepID=UPI00058B1C23|nr:hypothetical protein [Clostridium polynesiense]